MEAKIKSNDYIHVKLVSAFLLILLSFTLFAFNLLFLFFLQ